MLSSSADAPTAGRQLKLGEAGLASALAAWQGMARWCTAFREGDAAALRHLLILRFTVINLVAFALLGAAALKGWIGLVLDGDGTGLAALIALVFLFGLFECARNVWQTSRELDELGAGQPRARRVRSYLESVRDRDAQARAITGSTLKLKLAAGIGHIRHVANSLVFLGLIGTVLGFIIALSGVDPQAAADVSAIGPMVSILISGMSVALYTTLVGAVLNVWLMLNYRVLESGTVRLFTSIVEHGERHEQPRAV